MGFISECFFDIEDDYLSWSECLQATGEVAGLRDRLQRLEEECRFEGISKSDLRLTEISLNILKAPTLEEILSMA